MKIKVVTIALLGLIIYSCSPKIVPVVNAPKKEETIIVATNDSFDEGKNLFENNCAKCHGLPNTKDYSPQEWLPIMDRMKAEAQITDAESDKIYNYLIAN